MAFTQPILELIAGKTKNLRYRLLYSKSHNLKEVKYQKLQVIMDSGVIAVVQGVEHLRQNDIYCLEHEDCKKETLPSEYQKIADIFLKNEILPPEYQTIRDVAVEATQLINELKPLEKDIRETLHDILKFATYIQPKGKCCPSSRLSSYNGGSRK